jgi:hypothetical protein
MAMVVRRCTSCGNFDSKFHWRSIDEAVNDNALPPGWACPNCAWPEAELVEIDGSLAESENRREEDKEFHSAAGGHRAQL